VLTLIHRLPADATATVVATLSLTADERQRGRGRRHADDGQPVYLDLARGTVLADGDLLATANHQQVRVRAKPQPVLVVTASSELALLRAAYHLGNRHVPLEIGPNQLQLEPDPVLEALLHQLPAVQCQPAVAPFHPETGAYGGHAHG